MSTTRFFPLRTSLQFATLPRRRKRIAGIPPIRLKQVPSPLFSARSTLACSDSPGYRRRRRSRRTGTNSIISLSPGSSHCRRRRRSSSSSSGHRNRYMASTQRQLTEPAMSGEKRTASTNTPTRRSMAVRGGTTMSEAEGIRENAGGRRVERTIDIMTRTAITTADDHRITAGERVSDILRSYQLCAD